MATAKKKLLRTEDINEKTVIEATKRINDAVIKLSDHSLDRALEVKSELKELRHEVHGTNQRLDKLEVGLNGTNQRLDTLEISQQELRKEAIGTNKRLDTLEIGQQELRKEAIGTNKRLDKLEVGLNGTNQRLDTLEIGQQELRKEAIGTNKRLDTLDKNQSQMVDLLKQIAINTKKH